MLSRREFFLAAAALSLAPSARAFSPLTGTGGKEPILLQIFLRGGIDGLGIVAPVDDLDYVGSRPPELRLTGDGQRQALRLGQGFANRDFRLHPEMRGMHELFEDGRLAFVHACGLTNATRSHFEA